MVLRLTQVYWSGVSFWWGHEKNPNLTGVLGVSQQRGGWAERSTQGALPEGRCLCHRVLVPVGHCGESLRSCRSRPLGLGMKEREGVRLSETQAANRVTLFFPIEVSVSSASSLTCANYKTFHCFYFAE